MTMLGVYVGNDLNAVRSFEGWLGREVDGVLGYLGARDWNDFKADWAADLWRGIDRPVLWSVPLITEGSTLQAAASGAYNQHYRDAAKVLAATRPGDEAIYVRTGWEFNGSWFPWAAKGKEQAFIGAFRQFVDSFRSVSDRFRFEWCANEGDMGMDPAAAYPGDAYVDIIGMDFYYDTQWDPRDPVAAWDSMVNRPYGLQWHQDFAAKHGKPTAYSEWGVMSDGAGPYIERAAKWFADHDVVYQTYWDSNAAFPGKLSSGRNPGTGAEYRDEFSKPSAPQTPVPPAPVPPPEPPPEPQPAWAEPPLAPSGPQAWKTGGAGNDVLAGGGANDHLNGAGGSDRLLGGRGHDVYVVDRAGDVVVERAGEGIDRVESWAGAFRLPAHVENLVLMSATQRQTGTGNDLANRIVGKAADNVIDGGAGNDLLRGGGGNDTFVMRAGTGRDIVADFAAGAGTGDTVVLDGYGWSSFAQVKAAMRQQGADTVLSLPGGDAVLFRGVSVSRFHADDFTFRGAAAPAPVAAPWTAPALAPGGAQTWRTGGAGDDVFTGGQGNDFLNGAAGTDRLAGGAGHDSYVVDRAGDVIVERAGEGIDHVESWAPTFVLPTHVEHLTLAATAYRQSGTGNDLANRITGSAAENVIQGGGGDDLIVGGAGGDVLTGGAGRDCFLYRGLADRGDRITDFALGEDRLDLRAVGTVQFAPVAGGTGVLVDPDGPGGQAPVLMATLEGVGAAGLQASLILA